MPKLGEERRGARGRALAPRTASKACALELVALRGRDVVGVRHVQGGERAWIGDVAGSFVRAGVREIGAAPFVVGEVTGDRFVLHVPVRARARASGADGLGRLFFGPTRVPVAEGDRVVLLLGRVEIRARLVPVAALGGRARAIAASVARLVLAVLAVYAAVVVGAAPASPPSAERARLGAVWSAADLARAMARTPP
jgi:hypothetical protein